MWAWAAINESILYTTGGCRHNEQQVCKIHDTGTGRQVVSPLSTPPLQAQGLALLLFDLFPDGRFGWERADRITSNK